ncbi:hypothetical protein C7C56_026580 [Massilia glaciei]|uniref:RES domain-containing protein n=2 Tax=Massilia glaciei TaxID=1524097 RepID=A0A2U2HA08_9BURK|nr:hypothetical protein C7C56_026580 [Massilia glaciei]
MFSETGTHQCGRALSEVPLPGNGPAGWEAFEAAFEGISLYAGRIDKTMAQSGTAGERDDSCFTGAWTERAGCFSRFPQFRVHTDEVAETGQVPHRTGVYVSSDDPHAALQFAWVGGQGGRLLEGVTFNPLGLAALESVGRQRLWLDEVAMLRVVQANLNNADLNADPGFECAEIAELAPSLIARNAFTSRAMKWHYVEKIDGAFEEINESETVQLHR